MYIYYFSEEMSYMVNAQAYRSHIQAAGKTEFTAVHEQSWENAVKWTGQQAAYLGAETQAAYVKAVQDFMLNYYHDESRRRQVVALPAPQPPPSPVPHIVTDDGYRFPPTRSDGRQGDGRGKGSDGGLERR